MSPFLIGVSLLLVFQCIGEALSYFAGLPVPGPVLGMMMLLVVLRLRGAIPEGAAVAADGLARHLSLLFVPAGVGVMLHFGRLADEWLAVSVALVVSAIAAIAAAAVTFALVVRRVDDRDERGE
jgi:holin-like protein